MKPLRSLALGLGLLLVAAAAHAQGTAISANVPFSFVAGNQLLPAGRYEIRASGTDSSILTIRSSDRKHIAAVLTFPCGGGWKTPEKTQLLFHRVGEHYQLSRVQAEGSSVGQQLVEGRAYTEAASNQKGHDVVVVGQLIAP